MISAWKLAVALAVCGAALLPAGRAGQTAVDPRQVKSVYVDSFGDKPGARELRAGLVAALEKSRKLKVAATPAEADAVLTGAGETWIRGYYTLNPRDRYSLSDAHAVYGGYLSVELKGNKDETLWSYLVTPGRAGAEQIDRNLADQMAKKILAAVGASPGK